MDRRRYGRGSFQLWEFAVWLNRYAGRGGVGLVSSLWKSVPSAVGVCGSGANIRGGINGGTSSRKKRDGTLLAATCGKGLSA